VRCENLRGEILQVGRDYAVHSARDGCGEDVAIVGVGQVEASDERLPGVRVDVGVFEGRVHHV
jgi:hypothetical protein